MFKGIIGLIVVLFTQQTYANTQVSVGTGYQHASILGAQLAYNDGVNRYYVAAGVVGYGLGYDRVVSNNKKHSVGIAIGSEELTSENGFAVLTYNYYFTNSNESGWRIGATVGRRKEDVASFFGDFGEVKTHSAVSFDLSYLF
ncbi:hypothetical protein [Glaciecola sp. KUL10]|jgi:hypothetical protein|uniref:hypothetical protein n=1 Tax=Glaciecola sp. (strain KUL10) TaxID=2161813 RepID=UPI000D783767|nr:hypothetical protein [Glaciecola sp. KUL10]GBL03210.1 hypothetical protein KUL10_04910 [Glaciecola sp. KUL10]